MDGDALRGGDSARPDDHELTAESDRWLSATARPLSSRQSWLEASIQVRRQLLRVTGGVAPVAQDIIEHIRRLGHARTVTLVGPTSLDEAYFEVRLATGAGAAELVGRTYEKHDTLEGLVMQEDHGALSDAARTYCHHANAAMAEPVGPLLAVPLSGPGDMRGAIVASRGVRQAAFTSTELAMAQDLARQASIALQLADGQASSEQLRFREQQEVAVRHLHDDLIQELFGLSVLLESLRKDALALTGTYPPGVGASWDEATRQLSLIMDRLRSTLTTSPDPDQEH